MRPQRLALATMAHDRLAADCVEVTLHVTRGCRAVEEKQREERGEKRALELCRRVNDALNTGATVGRGAGSLETAVDTGSGLHGREISRTGIYANSETCAALWGPLRAPSCRFRHLMHLLLSRLRVCCRRTFVCRCSAGTLYNDHTSFTTSPAL